MKGIHIELKKSTNDLFGKSKWWGNPDLPLGYEFPCYEDENGDKVHYTFICQIRCDEIASYDIGNRLPHKGMLFFFARIAYYLGEDEKADSLYVWDKGSTRVLYFADYDIDNARSVVLVDDNDQPICIKERAIHFSFESGCEDGHKLLGEPYMYPVEERDHPLEKWVNLLQVDSDDDTDFCLNFMDTGLMFFMIDPLDLKQLRFEEVRGTMVSL